jgi:hypothetical protein
MNGDLYISIYKWTNTYSVQSIWGNSNTSPAFVQTEDNEEESPHAKNVLSRKSI